jgi:hypothetical protein
VITGLFLLIVFMPDCSWMGTIPKAFFKPPLLSPASFIASFPGQYFFMSIDLLLLTAAVFITLGIRTRTAGRVFVFLSLLELNFHYSFGKIDHSILLYCLLFCMSFTNWGTRLAIVPDKEVDDQQDQKALSLFAVLIAFAFFSSGIEKALNWFNFDFNKSGTAYWLYTGYYNLERHFLLAQYGRFFPFIFLKLMDFGAVVFELSPLVLLLISRRAWRIWLLTACIFHLMNTLILNIHFIFNVPVYLAFCDFSGLYRALVALLHKKAFVTTAVSGLLLIVILRLKDIFTYTAASNILFAEYRIEENLYVAAVAWITAIAIIYSLHSRRGLLKNVRYS